jgi:hypothetical protein
MIAAQLLFVKDNNKEETKTYQTFVVSDTTCQPYIAPKQLRAVLLLL